MTNLFENINEQNIRKIKRFLRATTVTYPKNVNILSNVNQDDFIAIVDLGSIQFESTDYDGNKSIIETINTGGTFGSLTFPIKNHLIPLLHYFWNDIFFLIILKYLFYLNFFSQLIF